MSVAGVEGLNYTSIHILWFFDNELWPHLVGMIFLKPKFEIVLIKGLWGLMDSLQIFDVTFHDLGLDFILRTLLSGSPYKQTESPLTSSYLWTLHVLLPGVCSHSCSSGLELLLFPGQPALMLTLPLEQSAPSCWLRAP